MSIKNNSRKNINLIIFSKFKLISQCLTLLIENKSEIKVLDCAVSSDNLLKSVSESKPDVVLLYLTDDEPETVEIVPELIELSPFTKVLVMCSASSSLDQANIIKLGATGIIGTHQKEEILIRAIRQVSDGEVWLSQKLIAQLFGNKNGADSNKSMSGIQQFQVLTGREVQIVKSIALGLNNKDISKKLLISEATVRHHLSSIYSKLYIADRLNLVIYAFQNKMVFGSTQNGKIEVETA